MQTRNLEQCTMESMGLSFLRNDKKRGSVLPVKIIPLLSTTKKAHVDAKDSV